MSEGRGLWIKKKTAPVFSVTVDFFFDSCTHFYSQLPSGINYIKFKKKSILLNVPTLRYKNGELLRACKTALCPRVYRRLATLGTYEGLGALMHHHRIAMSNPSCLLRATSATTVLRFVCVRTLVAPPSYHIAMSNPSCSSENFSVLSLLLFWVLDTKKSMKK